MKKPKDAEEPTAPQSDTAAIGPVIERQTELLEQTNQLLTKVADAFEKMTISYRVMMSFEGRIENLERERDVKGRARDFVRTKELPLPEADAPKEAEVTQG
jgi:hypothetical protein